MVFGYYNDACSNETRLFFALGRGIESVKNGPQWHWDRYYLDIQRVFFYCWPRHWGIGGIIRCYAAVVSFTLRHAVEQ